MFIPSSAASSPKSPNLPCAAQLVPVPLETVKALLQAIKESRSKKNKLERQLMSLQTKVIVL